MNRLKTSLGCADCGGFFHPVVMDFHHLDPESKHGTVGSMIRNAGMRRLKAEIRKCVLLCANCHRMRELGVQDRNPPTEE